MQLLMKVSYVNTFLYLYVKVVVWRNTYLRVLGFRSGGPAVSFILRYCGTSLGDSSLDIRPLKKGPQRSPETLATDHRKARRSIPEKRS